MVLLNSELQIQIGVFVSQPYKTMSIKQEKRKKEKTTTETTEEVKKNLSSVEFNRK